MRISVDSLLAGEHPPYEIGDVHVKLNGELIPRTIEADDQKGWVDHALTDSDGKLIPDQSGEYFQVVRSYGEVEFVFNREGK